MLVVQGRAESGWVHGHIVPPDEGKQFLAAQSEPATHRAGALSMRDPDAMQRGQQTFLCEGSPFWRRVNSGPVVTEDLTSGRAQAYANTRRRNKVAG